MNIDFTVHHVVTAPGLEALLTSILSELQGLRMDATELQSAVEAATAELKTTKESLDATAGVLDKVTNEETGLLVKIQTLTDLLASQSTALPPAVEEAVAALNTAVADVKASAASVQTKAAGADGLVADEPAA